jgi:hypothetical protein
MPRVRNLLWLLAVPLFARPTTPVEPVRKDVLKVSVRGDSGGAQRFTLVTRGFHVFSARRQDFRGPGAAPDTLTFVGTGTIELTSADSSRPVVADVWLVSWETSEPHRYSGRTLRIERAFPTSRYVVTNP